MLMLAGIFMTFQVFGRYEKIIIQNEDRQLLGLAASVDRSIDSYLYEFSRDLDHVVSQDGLTQTEEGDSLIRYQDENLLMGNPLTWDVVCVKEDTVLYSAKGQTGYRFLEKIALDENTWAVPCLDEQEECYLAILKGGEDGSDFGVLIRLEELYQAVAGNLIAGTQDQIFLMDTWGQVFIRQEGEEIRAGILPEQETGSRRAEDILLRCRTENQAVAEFYEEEGAQGSYTARMAAIPVQENNGVFLVGVSLNYDSIKYPVQMEAVRLAASGGILVLGLLLLIGLVAFVHRKTEKAERELAVLREKNMALEEISRKTQSLARHQRLETIGTMASSIAHEFNNLLTPIMGYSILVLEKLPSEEEELYDNVLEIYEASRKAKTIVSRLSDLSRKNSSSAFQRIVPDSLLRKVLEICAPAKPLNVEQECQYGCKEAIISGNEVQLSQMLLNLILNAYQAMEKEGGFLRLSTREEEKAVWFLVADTGPGIPESLMEKIFEPFFTTKERGKGTGLGLAIVRQVLQEHGGEIEVETREGEGTTMKVRLPKAPPRQGEESGQTPDSARAGRQPEKEKKTS